MLFSFFFKDFIIFSGYMQTEPICTVLKQKYAFGKNNHQCFVRSEEAKNIVITFGPSAETYILNNVSIIYFIVSEKC